MGEVVDFKTPWDRVRENFHATMRTYYVMTYHPKQKEITELIADTGDKNIDKYIMKWRPTVTEDSMIVVFNDDGDLLWCSDARITNWTFPHVEVNPKAKPEPNIKRVWRLLNKIPYYKEELL